METTFSKSPSTPAMSAWLLHPPTVILSSPVLLLIWHVKLTKALLLFLFFLSFTEAKCIVCGREQTWKRPIQVGNSWSLKVVRATNRVWGRPNRETCLIKRFLVRVGGEQVCRWASRWGEQGGQEQAGDGSWRGRWTQSLQSPRWPHHSFRKSFCLPH